MLSVDARDDLPKNIKYIDANTSINKKVKLSIRKVFSSHDTFSLFSKRVVCGPGLWSLIKKNQLISNIKLADVKFHLPVVSSNKEGKIQLFKGALFQTDRERSILATILNKLPIKSIKVRKINKKEAEIYWALIPYNIEEPVFIVEYGDKLRFLVDLDTEKNKIFWIDELSKYH